MTPPVTPPVTFPAPLDTPEFRALWSRWEAHRREIRKPLKPTSAAAALGKLAAWGLARATAAVEHTIAMGWQGLREPDRGPAAPAAGGSRFAHLDGKEAGNGPVE